MSEDLRDVTAAILAGGEGTRLRAAVPDRQKVVSAVAGRPFLLRLLDQVAVAGVRRVVLCTGYKGEQVREAVGAAYRGMSVRYSADPGPLGTAGALRHAMPELQSDPVLVMNGDSFCEVDLTAFLRAQRESGAAGSLVVCEVPDTGPSGRVDFDGFGMVTSFVEKGVAGGRGWINAGIYLLARAWLEEIPAGRAVSLERELFPVWAGRGLRAFPTAGKFLDIGTPESHAAAQKMFP